MTITLTETDWDDEETATAVVSIPLPPAWSEAHPIALNALQIAFRLAWGYEEAGHWDDMK